LLIKKIIILYQKISLDGILKELLYSDFAFINNVGFAVYNNILDKEDLDKILSNNRKDIYMLMFHMH
jgi:hypothetical protein